MCLYTVTIHANGQVAFQDNPILTSIVGSNLQLCVKQILNLVDEFKGER